jgi:hypothetical protein
MQKLVKHLKKKEGKINEEEEKSKEVKIIDLKNTIKNLKQQLSTLQQNYDILYDKYNRVEKDGLKIRKMYNNLNEGASEVVMRLIDNQEKKDEINPHPQVETSSLVNMAKENKPTSHRHSIVTYSLPSSSTFLPPSLSPRNSVIDGHSQIYPDLKKENVERKKNNLPFAVSISPNSSQNPLDVDIAPEGTPPSLQQNNKSQHSHHLIKRAPPSKSTNSGDASTDFITLEEHKRIINEQLDKFTSASLKDHENSLQEYQRASKDKMRSVFVMRYSCDLVFVVCNL